MRGLDCCVSSWPSLWSVDAFVSYVAILDDSISWSKSAGSCCSDFNLAIYIPFEPSWRNKQCVAGPFLDYLFILSVSISDCFLFRLPEREAAQLIRPYNLWCHASVQHNSTGNQLEEVGEMTLMLSRVTFLGMWERFLAQPLWCKCRIKSCSDKPANSSDSTTRSTNSLLFKVFGKTSYICEC